MWSSIVKSQPPPKPNLETPAPSTGVFVINNNNNCNSTKGIAVAVVDVNALIEGGDKLTRSADKLLIVPEVMAKVRDSASRHRLSSLLPSSVHSMDPSLDSLNKVIKFARATSDLQTLLDVDLKLIALTYTLEAQIRGTKHIRDCPPPVHVVNAKRLPDKELPGWGSNVPNLGEWEALERASVGDGGMSNSNSRILPLQDLNLNVVDDKEWDDGLKVGSENQEGEVEGGVSGVRLRRFLPKKKEVTIEGKKMVASGILMPF